MALSLMAGERVTLSRVDAFADGVAVKQVGAGTLRFGRAGGAGDTSKCCLSLLVDGKPVEFSAVC